MTIMFKGRTKQDTLDLFPGVPLAFDDAHAELYFVKAGFAEETDETPVVTYPVGSVTIDPLTVHSRGSAALVEGAQPDDHVMPEWAETVIAEAALVEATPQSADSQA